MSRFSRVDSNQPEIVKALRSVGAIVKHTHELKKLFDILVFFRGETYCVEIKDGEKTLSERRLTDGEKECKADLESVGVKYWVIESIEEALLMIGIKK